jgi:hypothetical protein
MRGYNIGQGRMEAEQVDIIDNVDCINRS